MDEKRLEGESAALLDSEEVADLYIDDGVGHPALCPCSTDGRGAVPHETVYDIYS